MNARQCLVVITLSAIMISGCAETGSQSMAREGTQTAVSQELVSSATVSAVTLQATVTSESSIDSDMNIVGDGFHIVAQRMRGESRSDSATGVTLSALPADATVKLDAQQAYLSLESGGNANKVRFAQLPLPIVELAQFTSTQVGEISPDGSAKPYWTKVPAWIFEYTDNFPQHHAPLNPTLESSSQSTSEDLVSLAVIVVVDANSGKFLMEQDGINLK